MPLWPRVAAIAVESATKDSLVKAIQIKLMKGKRSIQNLNDLLALFIWKTADTPIKATLCLYLCNQSSILLWNIAFRTTQYK